MWTGIDILLTLQDLRHQFPFLETISLIFSSRVVYLAIPMMIAAGFFWYIDRKKGEILILSIITSLLFVNLVKFGIAQPRPWDLDPRIERVEHTNAHGYSCPSGHSSVAASSYGMTALFTPGRVSIVLFIIAVMIVLSRLILCVHTPLDVICGIAVGVVFSAIAYYNVRGCESGKVSYTLMYCSYLVIFTALFIISVVCWNAEINTILDYSGFFYGAIIALMIEHMKVGYEVSEDTLKNKMKGFVIGMVVAGILLLVPHLIINHIGTFIGGVLMMLWCFLIYPKILCQNTH